MLANLLIRPGKLRLREVETPEPSKGEVLVKIKAALTCGTDLKAFKRGHPLMPMPTVFGHEFSGVVEKAGPGVRRFSKGMAIMAVHSAPCGDCCYCRKRLYNLCEHIMRTKALGAFAEYILLPEHVVRRNTFVKPKGLPYAEAAFLEPLSCVVHSVNSACVSRGDTAVVMGAGTIGLLHLMVLRAKGLKTIVIEKQRSRINKARDLGADSVIAPEKGDVNTQVLKVTGDRGADVVFECTGIPTVWKSAIWYVRKGGTVILFGGLKPGTRVPFDAARIHYDEIILKGVFHFTPADVTRAYKLLSGRKIKVRGLISGKYPLRGLGTALNRLSSGTGIKYAIIP